MPLPRDENHKAVIMEISQARIGLYRVEYNERNWLKKKPEDPDFIVVSDWLYCIGGICEIGEKVNIHEGDTKYIEK